ncbi:MAG: threonine dehydratase [Rhodospirillaceae bacterium]|jgi:threonine dehydratase|nr:threonine dehydratase [Rhodospirillaceae bacterium]MBT4771975.1 threonine dehydratase [Rhodospirillaceae bacterium]MBT5357284.1 threonine dehydratase [Rhodospirillaceae bacterium]MBT5770260.1 threonine dehydratase [Rhodospirillaceae bacterium]MBT6311107.1 threonine dehydratase [Rhodospirillaceae bacterium]
MNDLPTKSEIETAAETVYAAMAPTPQYAWPLLAAASGANVWVKHENHTPTGAFKVRGGLVHMANLRAQKPGIKGVIAATRGNHGQSIAYGARANGIDAVIVVPEGNSAEKNAAMQAFGAELVVHGHDFQAALEFAEGLADERDLEMIPSFAVELAHGVATYGIELLTAVPEIDTLYVPIGLGSGITGCIAAREALGLTTEIVGVVAENAPAYALSFAKGEAVSTNSADTFADGLACRVPATAAVPIICKHAARVITVSEEEIKAAIRLYFSATHNLVEGAGAAALAALMQERTAMAGKTVGVVLSGGNIDRALYQEIISSD